MSTPPSRFSIALDLACAAITVLFSGQVAEQMQQRSAESSSVPADAGADYVNASLYRTKLSRNILSRVARDLGLSRSHVCMVANGHRRSARVEMALEREYRRIESEGRPVMEQQPDTRPAQATRPPAKLSHPQRRRTRKRYSHEYHARIVFQMLLHGDPGLIVVAGLASTMDEVYRAMRGGGACDIRIRCALRTLQSLYRWHPIMRPEGFASWQEELEFRDEINAAALSCFVEASQ